MPGEDLCWHDANAEHDRDVASAIFAGMMVFGLAVGVAIVLLGLVFLRPSTTESLFVPIGLGGFVLALCGWGLVWQRRFTRHRIESARLTSAGVEVVLRNGTNLRAAWADAQLAVDFWVASWPKWNPPERHGLAWRMVSPVGQCLLTKSGWEQLMEAARRNGLSVTESGVPRGQTKVRTYKVRGSSAKA